jgi:hypothetical protein
MTSPGLPDRRTPSLRKLCSASRPTAWPRSGCRFAASPNGIVRWTMRTVADGTRPRFLAGSTARFRSVFRTPDELADLMNFRWKHSRVCVQVMSTVWATSLGLIAAAFTCRAMLPFPPMSEAAAVANADLLAQVKVLAIAPLVEDGVTQKWRNVVHVEILTQGVAAKTNASVLWDQWLANWSLTPKHAPEVGHTYRSYLRLRGGNANLDFEPVHPDWGFVESDITANQSEPTSVQRIVQKRDTLWGIAAHYYGTGTRWRVLRVANFTNDAPFGVYPLRSGMKLRIPVFPMNKISRNGPANGDQPDRSETNRSSSAAGSRR